MTGDDRIHRQLANAVKDRSQFEEIFDELASGYTPFTFKVLALLPAENSCFIHFRHAAEKGFLDKLVAKLLSTGAFNIDAVRDDDEVVEYSANLQAITRTDLGIANAEMETRGTLAAMRRLCCITVSSPGGSIVSAGTGFLIGPQLILTSFHAISSLLDEECRAIPGSDAQLRIAFDQINIQSAGTLVPAHKNWLVMHSKLHPLEESDNIGAVDWENVDGDGFDEHLDFAVLRLGLTVGRERGYYELDSNRVPIVNGAGAQVVLFQHPNGQPLSKSPGTGSKLWPSKYRTRLRHDANAAGGSSGGLLLDNEFKPIGLHQCGYYDALNKPLFNGAIPTFCIAKRNIPFGSVDGLDAIWKISGTREPVIGREDFQRAVIRAVSGETRILVVYGSPKIGRSFTTKIIREMLGTDEHRIVEMSASELGVTARQTAVAILERIGGPEASSVLPNTDESRTAMDAWIRDELFPVFSRCVQDYAGQRTVWLVVDDIDRYAIADTSTRIFLETLYGGISSLPGMRVLLIGLEGNVPGAIEIQVETEFLREFTLFDLENYLRRRWSEANVAMQPGTERILAQNVLDIVPRHPVSRQASLASAIAKAANGAS